MPTYNSYFLNSTPGSNVDWFAQQPTIISGGWTVNFLGSLAWIGNSDGTRTYVHGDIGGLSINGSGHLQGTIRWLTRGTTGGAEFEAVGSSSDHLNIDATSFSMASLADRFRLVFNSGSNILNGDAGDNRLGGGFYADIFNGGGGTDWADYVNSLNFITADLANIEIGAGDAFGDVYISIENLRGTNSAFGDRLLGTNGANVIHGLFGDDVLFGRGGDDTLHGGLGNDRLIGGAGNDTLNGGEDGIDEISYEDTTTGVVVTLHESGSGTVSATGGNGTDTYISIENVRGGAGADVLWGNSGANSLFGEGGSDKLYGGLGNDILNGGSGDDMLYGLEGDDTIYGGGGIDTLDYSIGPMPFVNLSMDEAGNGAVTMQYYGTDIFYGITNVYGTAGGDTFSGSNANNLFKGNAGNDRLLGNGGNDRLEGGEGNDTLFGDGDWGQQGGSQYYGDDVLLGEQGNDTLVGALGNDTLIGGLGYDTVTYGDLYSGHADGEFFIIADLSANTVSKYYYDYYDSIAYGYGTDTVIASGSDTIEEFFASGGNDTITDSAAVSRFHGGWGDDTYIPIADGQADWSIDAGGFDTVRFDNATSGVSVILYGLTNSQSEGGGIGTYNFTAIEQIVLTGFRDVVTVGVATQSGNDRIFGLGGNDSIEGGAGADYLDGGIGVDTLSYRNSTAAVTVSLAAGTATGGHADGDVFLNFESLLGSAFDDRLTGNAVKNELAGLTGRDVLRGGGGADRFAYKSVLDSTVAQAGRDVIMDFRSDEKDKIDLSAIDAIDGGGSLNDTFTFIGTDAFTARGQVRYFQSGSQTFIEVNTIGRNTPEMLIVLNGLHALTDGDFIL